MARRPVTFGNWNEAAWLDLGGIGKLVWRVGGSLPGVRYLLHGESRTPRWGSSGQGRGCCLERYPCSGAGDPASMV
jgi:hypothetical protein